MSGSVRIASPDKQSSIEQTNSLTNMGELAEIKIMRRSVPADIVSKILVGLPAKSVMRFSCVSKMWLSLINDPYFVQSHHARSYAHPDGINLIVCSGVDSLVESSCDIFYTDPNDKSPLKRLTLPVALQRFYRARLHSVRGLVCVGDCIWNPTINKSIILPPFSSLCGIDDNEVRVNNGYTAKYFLGFDTTNNTYKVFCIVRVYYILYSFCAMGLKSGVQIHDIQQIQFKILDLGGSSWRDIKYVPSQLLESIRSTKDSCSIDNLLFFRLNYSALAAFDLRCEKFEVIPIPDGLKYSRMHMIQVGDCISLIDGKIKTMWVSEDYKKHQWRSESLFIRPLIEVIMSQDKPKYMSITPLGSFHTSNEILLHIQAANKQYYYYYEIDSKIGRLVPELTQRMLDQGISYYYHHVFIKKHVESIYRLL